MSPVLAIAVKDLRQRLRDRSALVLGFLAPVAVAALISVAFGSASSFHADVAVVDLDSGPVATGFTAFVRDPDLADILTVQPVEGEADARARVADGRLDAAFVISPGFSAAVTSGESRPITVLASTDGTNFTERWQLCSARFYLPVVRAPAVLVVSFSTITANRSFFSAALLFCSRV